MKKILALLLITCVIIWTAFACTHNESFTKEWNKVADRFTDLFQQKEKDTKDQGATEEYHDQGEQNNANDSSQNAQNSEGEQDDNWTEQEQLIPLDDSTTREEVALREQIGLTDASLHQLKEQQTGNYAYDLLTDGEKQQLYVEIFAILTARVDNVIVCSKDVQEIDEIFQYVMSDHPEIFYVTGYNYTKYSVNESTRRIAFTGAYTMDREQILTMEDQINAYAAQCFAGMDETADDYHKLKYIYEYLINHTEYDLNAKENQNICSVCVYGASVCQGYAKTMQYLLNQIGIPATLVIGTVESGEGHAWNLVQLDGDYYYVDVTWGDAFYQLEGNVEKTVGTGEIPKMNYDYLCVTTEQLCTTHVIDNVVPMPRCISTRDNYYIREGAYFTAYDFEKVSMLFRQSYEKGMGFVTLKCSSKDVYREMKQQLIDEQRVFQLLQKESETVAYAGNEEQMTLTFWLS